MYVTDIRNHSQYKPALRQTLESICRTPAVATVTAVYRAVTVGKKTLPTRAQPQREVGSGGSKEGHP
jgi:hypothetical protein